MFVMRIDLETKGFEITSMELYLAPKTPVTISVPDAARRAMDFLTNLEEMEDVQKVYSNLDVPEGILSQIES